MSIAGTDLSFLLAQSINPAVVLDKDMRIVGLNEGGRDLHLEPDAMFGDVTVADQRAEEILRQCFSSSSKRRFTLALKEGFSVEVIGWRLSGPFRAKSWVMLQFIDLAQARSAFQNVSKTFQITQLTQSLASKNVRLEARLAEGNAELEGFNTTLEARIEERTASLVMINQELEDLTYIITHDLKVPIINLVNLTEILAADISDMSEEQGDIVEWMSKNCAQVFEKLNNLLEVAKARSAELSPRVPIALAPMAQKALEILHPDVQASKARITCEFEGAPQIIYLEAETTSLMQNLIGNAIKYAHPDRAPVIHLRSWTEPGYTCLSVRDNGTGLNLPTDEKKVFGMFKRAHVDPPGTGIALYTIRKKLERYDGQVKLASILGEWTDFTFMFPDP